MAKTLEITGNEQKAWKILGELAGYYSDNGGEPDGNAWLPSQPINEDEATDILEADLGQMVNVWYANDEAMLRELRFAPLAYGEKLEEETIDQMKSDADAEFIGWTHYGAYGASDSLWIFVRHAEL